MRFNGIGTTYLGFTKPDDSGCAFATRWFTLVYLPIKPLQRHKVRLQPPQGAGIHVQVVEETPLVAAEVRRTRLFGLLLFPLLLLWPIPFAVASVPYLEAGGDVPWWANGAPIVAIVWLIAASWKLADWHEARAHLKVPRASAKAKRAGGPGF